MASSPIQDIAYYEQVKVVYTTDVPNQTIAPVFKKNEGTLENIGFPTLQKWSTMLPVIDYKNSRYYKVTVDGKSIVGYTYFFITESTKENILSASELSLDIKQIYVKNGDGLVVQDAQGLKGYANRLYIESSEVVTYDTPTGPENFNVIKMTDGSNVITKYNLS